MFTFVILIITIIICLSHVCFGHFKYLSAHNYKVTKKALAAAAAVRPLLQYNILLSCKYLCVCLFCFVSD